MATAALGRTTTNARTMKLFWLIIALFALTAGAMVWAQTRVEAAAQSPSTLTAAPSAADPITAQPPEEIDRSAPDPFEAFDQPEDFDDLASTLANDLMAGSDARPPLPGSGMDAPAGHDQHQQQQQPAQAENPWATGERKPLEHSIEKNADGTTTVDMLFTIKGDGTPGSPYEITWDLLMSAAEMYQPRLGMTQMPERIKMLDGKHVKISGFLLFPMASFEAKEALVMLNMWDGCCIGTMPSPYDAIEVQFTQGIPASVRQFAEYGTIEGKLIVDPYLISDWLIGLYMLEDARLNVGM